MNKLRFLISASLSVLCVLLLTNERREVVFVPVRPIRLAIYSERFFSNFSVQHFDLTKEPDVRTFREELQNVHQGPIGELYENLICLPLGEIEIFNKRTELQINEVSDELVGYLNRTVYAHLSRHPMHFVNPVANFASLTGSASNLSSRQKIVMNSKLLNKRSVLHLKLFELTILESIKSKRFYFLQNQLCIVHDLSFFSRMLSEIFLDLKHYVLLKSAFRLFRLRAGESFDLTLISNEENPNLDCSAEKSTKFRCLNECWKEKHKLSDYFYAGDETATVQLTGPVGNRSHEASGRPATEHEESCFKRCAKSDCIQVNLKRKPFDNFIEITVVKARPIISEFYYCLLLVGLILALFKTSCYKLVMQLAEFISKRVSAKRRSLKSSAGENEESNLLAFQIAAFLACFVVFLILANKIIADYIERRDNQSPRLAVTYLSKPEVVSLVICVPVDKIWRDLKNLDDNFNPNTSDFISLNSHYNGNYSNLGNSTPSPDRTSHEAFDEDPSNLSLASLETLTQSTFNETLDEIYLEFLGRRHPVFWRWLSRLVFFHNVNHKLSRCERVYVKAEDPIFRSFLAASKLVITLKHSAYSLFLIPGSRKFNSKSYRYDRASKFVKAIHRSEQCTNYPKRFRECDSMANCWEQCVHNETLERGRNISADFVIDKDQFSQKQWSELFVDRFYDKNDEVSRGILGACNEKFRKPDCATVQFQTFGKFRVPTRTDERVVKFGLYFDVFNFVGEPSRHRLLLELGNAANLLYDLNFLQLVTFVFLRLKIDLRANKLCSLPFVLLSLLGFGYHLLFILEGIQAGQLLYSQYGEEPNMLEMPELFLCFDTINSSSIDHKLTGNYLETLTNDTRVETVFKQISYLTNRNDWVVVNFTQDASFTSNQKTLNNSPSYLNQPNDTENEFRIETVYFFEKKCFRIRHRVDYSIGQFYFFDEFTDRTQAVLKIDFNRSFVSANPVTFFTKPRDKLQDLSALVSLNYSRPNRSHLVKQHSTAMTYENKFNVIKNFLSVSAGFLGEADEYLDKMRKRFAREEKSNPMNLLKNALSILPTNHLDDIDMYLSRLRNNFKRDRNATTLHLPLERGDFHLQINDSAFEEFYERVQRPKDRNSADSLLYAKRTPINLLKELPKAILPGGRMRTGDRKSATTKFKTADKGDLLADFVFHLIFYRQNEVIRGNEESWSRLILNLLNLFTAWMNLKAFRRLPLSSGIAKLKSRFKSKRNAREDHQTIRKTLHTTISRSLPDLDETDHTADDSRADQEAIEAFEDYDEIRREVKSTERSISQLDRDHF